MSVSAQSKIDPLTSLRFFAAAAVLCFHSGASMLRDAGAPTPIVNVFMNGYLGISFFFVLSGFILTKSYAGRLNGSSDLKSYFVARFARIYPVFLLSILVMLPLLERPFDHPGALIATLAMVHEWTPVSWDTYGFNMPAWTLSIEFFYYLLFPVLLFVTSGASMPTLWLSFFAAGLLIAGLHLSEIRPGPGSVDTLAFEALAYVPTPILKLPEFVFGLLAARLAAAGAFDRVRPDALLAGSTIILLAAMASTQSPWVASAATLAFAAIIIAASRNEGWNARLLSWRPLVLLGGASYALYILQTGICLWIHLLIPDRLEWLAKVVYQPSLLLISIAVFLFYEEPLRRLLRLPRPQKIVEPA